MRIDVEIPGLDKIERDLARMPAEVEAAVQKGLAATAMIARNEAVQSIQKGPKTGQVYEWVGTSKDDPRADRFIRAPQGHAFPARKRPTPHQASAPGQPPATDTGALVASVLSEPTEDRKGFRLVVRRVIAIWLEFGTRFMLPRPFIRPAGDRAAKQGLAIIKAYVEQVVRGRK